MRHILGAAAAIASVFATGPAGAGGVYAGGAGGLNLAGDMDFAGAGIDRAVDFDAGAELAGALGYGFGNGVRSELELTYRRNGADGASGVEASGDANALTAMLNLLYDLDLGGPFTPYLGAGAGVARVAADGIAPVSGTRIDDNDTGFAVQGLAGVSFALDDRWTISADYQHLRVPDLTFRADSGVDVDSAYSAHSFRIGLRFAFGGEERRAKAEPGALGMQMHTPDAGAADDGAPAAAAAGPQRFVVLFDWDSAELTARAETVLDDAVRRAKAGAATVRILATGHTDRSGPADYNMKLSRRRAEAVRADLVRRGIAADRIAVAWKGEREPQVPTADGQREPENRRVEIVLR